MRLRDQGGGGGGAGADRGGGGGGGRGGGGRGGGGRGRERGRERGRGGGGAAPRPDKVFPRVRFSPRRGRVVTVVNSSPVPSPTPLEWSTVRSCSQAEMLRFT